MKKILASLNLPFQEGTVRSCFQFFEPVAMSQILKPPCRSFKLFYFEYPASYLRFLI